MAKKLSITMCLAPSAGNYLILSDALNQILDLVDVIVIAETSICSEQQVVWRLTEAHTNSPPFTVAIEPFSVSIDVPVNLTKAESAVKLFDSEFRKLLLGNPSKLMMNDARKPVERILERNSNGIEQTDIRVNDNDPISIRPKSARIAREAISSASESNKPDWERTEFGMVEGEIHGLTKWKRKPALVITERLSEKPLNCVLSDSLSKKIGPEHQWSEVWEGNCVSVSGTLHYNSEGELRRVEANQIKKIDWTDVPLTRLRNVDVLKGRTLAEHLDLIRSE